MVYCGFKIRKKYLTSLNYVVEHSFNVLRKDLGFNDITVHTLRHTFASRLAQLRVPILNIQQKKRLKNINITFKKCSFVYKHTLDMNVLVLSTDLVTDL
jgi:site-specific recombinase XerD